ncbi:MAG: hypothetical protein JSV56_09105 [Methanomassiliicoccales archaeon]|nr:MAG: hypothetical protein JSV56_09105 [Methanomassiliicoccales archaeon]
MMSSEDMEDKGEEKDISKEKLGFFSGIWGAVEGKFPQLAKKLKDIRVQAFLLFLILLIFYLNLITWDFSNSPDSIGYGLTLKNWFEKGNIDNYDLLRPSHPLVMPLAILFTYLMVPLIGPNYLLSFAILDAILGAGTVAIFYLVCYIFVHNRKLSLICSLGLAFSFAFWYHCEMAEDRSLCFILFTLYIPVLFSFMGEIKPFRRFEALKTWQKGLFTGLLLGLTVAAHITFVLVFLFTLILGWKYFGLKFFKSARFIWFLIGTVMVCGIVFGATAWALEVGTVGEFFGIFTGYHAGGRGEIYFALANPESFSLVSQFQGLTGGVFTTVFMFISDSPGYRAAIIGVGAAVFLVMAYFIIYARKNRVVNSLYILMVIWFVHYFFFSPDDRNSWVYLLIPIWLVVCVSANIMLREGVTLMLAKRRLSDKAMKALTPVIITLVVIILLNNIFVFADAHFNQDERKKLAQFVDDNIPDDNAIIIVDDSTVTFFNYYSEKEALDFRDIILNSQISDYVNDSFSDGDAIYIADFWINDSYIVAEGVRYKQSYDERLAQHREYITAFNSMYTYELAFEYEWSNIYRITAVNETR